jgi:hypothetical protein
MKALLFAFLITGYALASSADPLIQEFEHELMKRKLGPVTDQAFCYRDEAGVRGYRTAALQRIASVTKLFTTLLATETRDLSEVYETELHIAGDHLHIRGGNDPYFEEDKLLLLFKALNNLGYFHFRKVTFDKNFRFNDLPLEEYEVVTPNRIRSRLSYYLSSKNVKSVKATWAQVRKFAEEEGVELPKDAPKLTASSVAYSQALPAYAREIYVHVSRPLHSLLKAMNVQSKNFVAENVYEMSSSIMSLENLLSRAGISSLTYRIANGSGLPILTGKRVDNLATCSTVLDVVSLLERSLKKQGYVLSDVVAVSGGKDLGSFRTRFREFPETNEAVISKTGTLKHTSSLAGVLLLDKEVPFAILNHTERVSEARLFQDKFISIMFSFLGTPHPVPYEKISIFPWDGSDFLVPLNTTLSFRR